MRRFFAVVKLSFERLHIEPAFFHDGKRIDVPRKSSRQCTELLTVEVKITDVEVFEIDAFVSVLRSGHQNGTLFF
jgi:hypothetical protein